MFVLILVVAMLLCLRFLETYDIRVVRRAAYEKQIEFGRTPVMQIGVERYAVLGVKFAAMPQKRAVIVRNIKTSQIMTANAGQLLFDGVRVVQITENQVTFSKDSQTVIVGLPRHNRQPNRRWI
jgi:hypothetical protein